MIRNIFLNSVAIIIVFLRLFSRFDLATSFSGPFTTSISCSSSTKKFHRLYETLSPPVGTPSPVSVPLADDIFHNFVTFLQSKQSEIINSLEEADPSTKFSRDKWGFLLSDEVLSNSNATARSGGITRVIQGGSLIEKGAVSLTIIEHSVLSSERAKAIRARSLEDIREGDIYSAAALSIVLHTRSPMVPTFRSDVRIFLVRKNGKSGEQEQENKNSSNTGDSIAWFGGGADLTPYYIFEEDIRSFHQTYRNVCDRHFQNDGQTYREMKKMCDNYFYLPARAEHRGTGGIFFDDMIATEDSFRFAMDVVNSWMPSWLHTIVEKRKSLPYTDHQRQWQLLRRGRYLEFNLLYDRGVRFGLAGENPRVENVMVSAPPLIAFAYNHAVDKDSEEEKILRILKTPRDWLSE